MTLATNKYKRAVANSGWGRGQRSPTPLKTVLAKRGKRRAIRRLDQLRAANQENANGR